MTIIIDIFQTKIVIQGVKISMRLKQKEASVDLTHKKPISFLCDAVFLLDKFESFCSANIQYFHSEPHLSQSAFNKLDWLLIYV